MPLSTGQPAPDFTLFSDDMEPFTLSDHKGTPVLLLFFPGAFTSVCTTELNTVNNSRSDYGEEVQIVGISTDSPFVLSAFSEVNDLQFMLLSDHDAEVSATYGAKYDRNFTDMRLDRIARRAAFVIDADGLIQYAEVLDNAGKQPNFEAIRETLTSL